MNGSGEAERAGPGAIVLCDPQIARRQTGLLDQQKAKMLMKTAGKLGKRPMPLRGGAWKGQGVGQLLHPMDHRPSTRRSSNPWQGEKLLRQFEQALTAPERHSGLQPLLDPKGRRDRSHTDLLGNLLVQLHVGLRFSRRVTEYAPLHDAIVYTSFDGTEIFLLC